MLKSPVLKAKPTDKPVRTIGVAKYITLPILRISRKAPVIIVENPPSACPGLLIKRMTKPNSKPTTMAKIEGKKLRIVSFSLSGRFNALPPSFTRS